MTQDLRIRWEDHYASGNTPWDTQVTPPEVQSFWATNRLPACGLALDIGCGPGTNVQYLAERGLFAIGFDIALQAVRTGRERILGRAPALSDRAWLVQADVTKLPLYNACAGYILDLGCSHGIPLALRPAFVAGITANLRPGGYYHLYAFDCVPQQETSVDGSRMGMLENEVVERFTPALEIVEIVRAQPDRYPCRWYLLRKPD